MLQVDGDFIGGNILVKEISENKAVLSRDLRDTETEWFFWAFRVRGAAGMTVTFDMTHDYIGKFGPAVSHDGASWEWLMDRDNAHSFTYTFGEGETCVYFAHHMLYHPDRFYEFCSRHNLACGELGKSKKTGESIPYLAFGEGTEYILLTARHHACESTGSYVLEGVLDELLLHPLKNFRVVCVPFVDYDGVCCGDQGKGRFPHDHNRDYGLQDEPIYDTVKSIREFAKTHPIKYAFDFHSPAHEGERNDTAFIVRINHDQVGDMIRFGKLLEEENTSNALAYHTRNDINPDVDWNCSDFPTISRYIYLVSHAVMSFSFETCYFGTPENRFSAEGAVALGRNFARALAKFEQ